MRVQVTLRGAIAGNDQPQQRMTVHLPWGATVEQLLAQLSIPSEDVQMALVNGSPVARTAILNQGDRVILAGASKAAV